MPTPSGCNAGRLVYVGQIKDFSDLRLESIPETGWNGIHYAVLSHRWGGVHPFQLTTENIQDLTKKIEFLKLGLTFRHAVIATKFLPDELNVRYIWIDSLCIIQNSKEDKDKEIPKMGLIYRNALICLAAKFGKDGRAGLFRKRNAQSLQSHMVRPEWDEKGRTFACEDRRPEQTMLESSDIGKCAWCFQEAILAPRILHFSVQQFFWECSTLTLNEAYPKGIPKRGSFRKTISLDSWTWHQPGANGDRETEQYRIWDSMVQRYSQCQMSENSDKLVAIGSLALSLQNRLHGIDTYVAGLWSSQLAQALVWKLIDCDSGPGIHKSKPWRALSWSWAATDGQALLRHRVQTSSVHATIIDLDVRYNDDNLVLGVTKAELRIRGPIALCDLQFTHSQEELADKSKYRSFKSKLKGVEFKDTVFRGEPVEKGANPCQFDTRLGHLTQDPIYAILILSAGSSSKGLMIQKHPERTGCFERCGRFALYEAEDQETFFKQCRITSLEGCICQNCDLGLGEHAILLL